MKKLISTALTVIMLLTAIISVFPIAAFAAMSPADEDQNTTSLTLEEIKSFINNEYLLYSYETAEEMLADELALGYLDWASSENGNFTLYVNRYSGFVYYVNNATGQILTSNPIDPYVGSQGEEERQKLMSQLEVYFYESSNSTKSYTYNSVKWAALYSQISVSKIAGGLRVNYTLGDTTTRFLLPGRISAENFYTYIMNPMITEFENLFAEAMATVGREDEAFKLVGEGATYKAFVRYADKSYDPYVLNTTVVKKYFTDAQSLYNNAGLSKSYAKALDDLRIAIITMMGSYSAKNPKEYTHSDNPSHFQENGSLLPAYQERLDAMIEKYPVCEQFPIYVFKEDAFANNNTPTLRQHANYIKAYCPDYTMNMMYDDEKACEFEYVAGQKPVIRCALEYTFNEDGTLSVRLPANSVTFDESAYTIGYIKPLSYFGCGDMTGEGYMFFPDGSGSILDFSDFYSDVKKTAVSLKASVYGQDYCYSKISGQHREQITMPVYGLVSTTKANAITQNLFGVDTITTGYFAIVEEGASLATLGFESGGGANKYATTFATYNPYPSDTFDLSQTLSVGALGAYTMVSESKYLGSYVTRIVMLTDKNIGDSYYGQGNYYDTSYSGMAAYYRNYLKANGTLGALEIVSEDIPLYIEALGSMTIMSRFLTFPVEKSIPLTTFDDVQTMYRELSDAKNNVEQLIKKYSDLAKTEKNDLLKIEYQHKAEKFEEIADQIEDIKNINFKLTGFANGGMYFTYPSKLKWERVCGGKSGFTDLVAASKTASAEEGVNFGVYPEFDFLYISNTAAFDGVKIKKNVSRMVDNRYASKQVYNSVIQQYETFFTLVVSSDMLLENFAKFNKKFSKFEHNQISVSTLGSDLNSNFNEKNPISREDSMNNSIALLEEMVYNNNYQVMVDKGNIYSAKYATHIINASTDFSNFRYSSYAIPFVGMILHGHVNYSGAPLNYTGSPDYAILRAIESGAAPYYILCYQNSPYMKEDEALNKYYGVDYTNWYDEILVTYHKLNVELSGLQEYEIVDHKVIISERTPEYRERLANYNLLKAELIEQLKAQLIVAVDAKIDEISDNGKQLRVDVDVDALYDQFISILNQYPSYTEGSYKYSDLIENDVVVLENGDTVNAIKQAIREIAIAYANEYPGAGEDSLVLDFDSIEYSTKYHFNTVSKATDDDDDYVFTDYTLDNGNVVMVTYQKGNDTVSFVLNYNIYSVDVIIDGVNGGRPITVGHYGYYRIDK